MSYTRWRSGFPCSKIIKAETVDKTNVLGIVNSVIPKRVSRVVEK